MSTDSEMLSVKKIYFIYDIISMEFRFKKYTLEFRLKNNCGPAPCGKTIFSPLRLRWNVSKRHPYNTLVFAFNRPF